MNAHPAKTPPCERCLKRAALCVCSKITELPARTRILILQHPQEPDKDLGSARIASLSLPNSKLVIGLSWPNLKTLLAKHWPERGDAPVDGQRWAVLYLGSGIKGPTTSAKELQLIRKNGEAILESDQILKTLEGVILLDGTWSQAKTLWWRNAWLLKLRRAVLKPRKPSLYGELRKEPRKECLSTIESIAAVLDARGEDSKIGQGLRSLFSELLALQRARFRKSPSGAPVARDEQQS